MLTKLKMRFKKPKEVLSLEVIAEKCSGCGNCIDKCKRNVFEIDFDNQIARVANLADCVGCGKCVEKMCNFGAIKLVIAQ